MSTATLEAVGSMAVRVSEQACEDLALLQPEEKKGAIRRLNQSFELWNGKMLHQGRQHDLCWMRVTKSVRVVYRRIDEQDEVTVLRIAHHEEAERFIETYDGREEPTVSLEEIETAARNTFATEELTQSKITMSAQQLNITQKFSHVLLELVQGEVVGNMASLEDSVRGEAQSAKSLANDLRKRVDDLNKKGREQGAEFLVMAKRLDEHRKEWQGDRDIANGRLAGLVERNNALKQRVEGLAESLEGQTQDLTNEMAGLPERFAASEELNQARRALAEQGSRIEATIRRMAELEAANAARLAALGDKMSEKMEQMSRRMEAMDEAMVRLLQEKQGPARGVLRRLLAAVRCRCGMR